ncbi:MAG: hydantoinase, partial [Planctomycetaceae bacterium]|nr:hydantoinase [Planctomycetaceae bacterium]
MAKWRFFIDVGGTFTDVIACDPQGCWHSHKTLSSGLIKGTIDHVNRQRMTSSTRIGDPNGLWQGYSLSVLSSAGKVLEQALVQDSDSATGQLILDRSLPVSLQGLAYELNGYEPAPVVSIRYLLGLSRSQSIPPVILKLGTTRGTNALLERKGARCGYVTTS